MPLFFDFFYFLPAHLTSLYRLTEKKSFLTVKISKKYLESTSFTPGLYVGDNGRK